jgi:hypothetical protein
MQIFSTHLAVILENELQSPREQKVQSSVGQRSVLMVDLVKLGELEMKELPGTMAQFQEAAEENLRIHLNLHARTDADFARLAVSGNVAASCSGIGAKTWAADHGVHDPYHVLFHYVCHVHVLSHCEDPSLDLSHYAAHLDQYAKMEPDLPSRGKKKIYICKIRQVLGLQHTRSFSQINIRSYVMIISHI